MRRSDSTPDWRSTSSAACWSTRRSDWEAAMPGAGSLDAARDRPLGLLDDVGLHGRDGGEQLVLLLLRDLELLERTDQMLDRQVPIVASDAQTLVGRLHVAAEVQAGASRRGAELIHHHLPEVRLGIVRQADEEAVEDLVGGEPSNEIVRDRRDRVIPSDPLVERRRLRRLRLREPDRAGHHPETESRQEHPPLHASSYVPP